MRPKPGTALTMSSTKNHRSTAHSAKSCVSASWSFRITLNRAARPPGMGTNERELLRGFWAHLAQVRPSLFITHNGLGFDLPFIKKRSIIHQVKPTMEINLAKFRTEPVYDTMAIWSNWDNRGWVKLDVLARASMWTASPGAALRWRRCGRMDRARKSPLYCLQDTYVTYGCYCRMNFRQPISRDVVLLKPELIDVG